MLVVSASWVHLAPGYLASVLGHSFDSTRHTAARFSASGMLAACEQGGTTWLVIGDRGRQAFGRTSGARRAGVWR